MNESASQADMAWQGADRKVEAMEPIISFAKGRQRASQRHCKWLPALGKEKERGE